jgi:hypothetical protein
MMSHKPLNILGRKDSMAGWGKIPHGQKKELSNALKKFPTSRPSDDILHFAH